VKLRALHPTIGVDVTGAASTVADVDALRDALDQRHLLLVRGIPMSGEAQVAFAARFGTLIPERQLWGYVSNVRPDGIVREGALRFHSDFAFTPWPVSAICLHALDVPNIGAPTYFADAVAAAAALPDDLRGRLAGRAVLNLYDFALPDDRPHRISEADPRAPRCQRPVLGAHPRTGVELVFANELHSDQIVGLPRKESDALLADLFAVLYDGANVYEHRWVEGDLVLWDNIALHHGRPDFPRHVARTLQRVTLGDYTPAELVPNLAELLDRT
jgi:taurine dioxygenase